MKAVVRKTAAKKAAGKKVTKPQRSAGTPPVVDTHAHWFPPEWIDLMEAEGNRNGAVVKRTADGLALNLLRGISVITPPLYDMSLRLQAMRRQKVDVQALSMCSPMVYWAPPEFGLRLSQVFNDACAAAHLQAPERFVGMAMLPMQAPVLALAELERAARLPGLRGVYMATNVNGKNLDDESFFPIYAKCEALGWPIFLHPVETIGPERTQKYHLKNLLGIPYETGIAAASLIFGGVLDTFPKLEVMLSHAGGAFPWLTGRMDHGTRVRPELAHMKRTPSRYLRRFTYDTITHSPQIMSYLIDLVGADRIMLGSDYCFDMGYARPVAFVDKIPRLAARDRNLMLGATAARLLKL
jgi:aminocarboxymuconate-semialdehyde decarboxylase